MATVARLAAPVRIGQEAPQPLPGGRVDDRLPGALPDGLALVGPQPGYARAEQPVHIRAPVRDRDRRDLHQVAVTRLIGVPLRSVGHHADVALPQLARALRDVAGQLLLGLCTGLAFAEILLDLDHGEADLDVDASAVPDLCLQRHDLLGIEPQRSGEQQLTHVGLHHRLGPRRPPIGQPGNQLFHGTRAHEPTERNEPRSPSANGGD